MTAPMRASAGSLDDADPLSRALGKGHPVVRTQETLARAADPNRRRPFSAADRATTWDPPLKKLTSPETPDVSAAAVDQ